MKLVTKSILAFSGIALLSGCAVIDGVTGSKKDKTTPTIGNRIDILGTQVDSKADPALAGISVILPPAQVNLNWPQPGGNAAKSPGHITLGQGFARVWGAKIAPASNSKRLAAAPVVNNGKLYVVDTQARVSAFDAATGAAIWSTLLETDKDGRPSAFGGGVSAEGNMVYATNGVGDIAALDANSGAIMWTKRPAGPLRGAPTVAIGNVYVMTQDNQIYALRTSDGEQQWNEAGPLGTSGIFGVAAPAVASGTVIAGYSTGELTAYRYENGRNLWADSLSRTSMRTSVSTLIDIDADPVIDRGRVFALGKGGRMASYELNSGQRLWEINIAGIATPVVSGEWVFVLTDDAKMLCIQRSSGKIRWISQLKAYKKEKSKKGAIGWRGPVLAGNRLIAVNTLGEIWSISPGDGTANLVYDNKERISVPPLVANNMLYILDDKGRISAFK
ncbi:MAG: PQQ-binding-like beta-propeller repeat protein [Sphingorhabdus sp.]